MTRISVIGLGKLGLPMASVFAKVGKSGGLALPIIGVDIDKEKIDRINRGECPIPEPDVGLGGIAATTDYNMAAKTDITFIVVNTPPRANGKLCLDDLERSCHELAQCLKDKSHIVVITSTVPPGTLDSLRGIFPSLVSLAYNPHFIALGKVVKDLTQPDFLLVGSKSEIVGREVARIWSKVFTTHEVKMVLTTPIMAELIKFALTPYLCMRINYANFLAELCDRIPGTDVDQILEAVGLDRRINTKELSAGLPWGGECYPKDVDAFIEFSRSLDINPKFLQSIAVSNHDWSWALLGIIENKIGSFWAKRIAFLGISYKAGYPLLNMSKPLELASRIMAKGAIVKMYDPNPAIQASHDFPTAGVFFGLVQCLKDTDAVIIAVPYPEFRSLRLRDLPSKDTPVIDIWRVLKGTELAKQGNWMPLGVGK